MSKSLLVGVIGHVDHGKTALVGALTGMKTGLPEDETARGVLVVPGFALLKPAGAAVEAGEIDLVDLPGHAGLVRDMIATGMRAVLLAVDAHEGIRPQTIEQLEIAQLIGVRRGVVALTRCDRVGPETVAARMAELSPVAARAGLEEARVVATSALTGTGLPELKTALFDLLRGAPPASDDGFPYLPIDDVFAGPGFGAVVTGTLRRGRLGVGERVEIMPGGQVATVQSLQTHGRAVQMLEPGRRVSVALHGVASTELHRGQALGGPGMLAASRRIDVALTAVPGAAALLEDGTACRLLFGTAEVPARLRLLDREALEPGASALAQLRTEDDVAVPAREPFILRFDSPSATVAGGRVLDPLAHEYERHDPRVQVELAAAAAGRLRETLAARLARDGATGTSLPALARLVGSAPERVHRTLNEIGAREIGAVFLGAEAFAALRAGLTAALDRHHRDHPGEHGLPLDRLATAVAAAEPVVAAALRDLAATRDVAQAGPLYRRAAFEPGRHVNEHVRALETVYRNGALSPPDEIAAVGRDIRRREALTYLLASGALIRALDRVQKRTILFHRDAIGTARATLAASFPQARSADSPETGFLAREAGAVLGISRKFSIPLLEHLDATHFTRRLGDRRIILEALGEGPAPTA